MVVAIISVTVLSQKQQNYHPAHSLGFNFLGRVDTAHAEGVRYDWSGVQVRFRFTGDRLGLHFTGGERNYFNVFIGGELKEVVHSPGDTTLFVNGIRGNGPHEVIFYKRTEGGMGQTVFKGVKLAAGGLLLPWNKISSRRLEFIGNSITCGYGTEGANKDEDFKPETENAWKAYGAILSRALHADCHLISHSGLGVVRNYGDEQKVSTREASMPNRYHQTLDTDPALSWDFSRWQPHAVIINLGTNDFSTQPYPDKVVFQRRYEQLITQIRANYGTIPVFCVVGPMIDEPCYSHVKEMVKNYNILHHDEQIYFAGIPTALLNQTDDLGSDWHPSYKGQQKMADHLLPVIATVLGWD